MPINRDLVSANMTDLRRLSLLATLTAFSLAGGETDPDRAAATLTSVFRGLPGCLGDDVEALCEDGLILPDETLASTRNVTVAREGRQLVEHLQETVEADRDARTAVVSAMVLHYMHHIRARVTTTEELRQSGVTVLGAPLPDGCVEEAVRELYNLGLVNGELGHQGGRVIPYGVTSKGCAVLRTGRPVLLPDREGGGASSVFNTTINGGIQGQNVAVASQGDVNQNAITVDQAMADLRVAVDALYQALAGQEDLQDKIEELLAELDKTEGQGSKSPMARVLSSLSRLAQRASGKGVDQAVTLAVTESATMLMRALAN
jgi:hypothetical protein